MTLDEYLESVRAFKPTRNISLDEEKVRKGWEFNVSINHAYRQEFPLHLEARLLLANALFEQSLHLYLEECFRFSQERGTVRNEYWIRPNVILNLKLILGDSKDLAALELLYSLRERTTPWCSDKLSELLHTADFHISEDRHKIGKTILRYIAEHNLPHFSSPNDSADSIYTEVWPFFTFDSLEEKKANVLLGYRGVSFFQAKLGALLSFDDFSSYLNAKARQSEDTMRVSKGLPKVGEGWISETELYETIKSQLSGKYKVFHHGRPQWLGRQHFDVWIPELQIAVEYQGMQHFEPVEYFGGEEAFQKNLERDARKSELAQENGVLLIFADESTPFSDIISQIETRAS